MFINNFLIIVSFQKFKLIIINLSKQILSNMKFIYLLLFFAFLTTLYSQNESDASGSIEIFVIDSYITPESPNKFVLSFFTSDSCTSSIIFNNREYIISKEFTDNHKFNLILENDIISTKINYKIIVQDRVKELSYSELYEVEIPQEMILAKEKNLSLLQVCCFGGIIFGLPSPTLVLIDGETLFSLSKEIPIFSFYSTGYNFPLGYVGIEYAHIFNYDKKNFLRFGYKHIIQLDFIKYISGGINYFTDFKGYNGVSTEFSLGLFQIQNVFTLFTRYRFNFQTVKKSNNFHEISIGLYSNFFSINF